MERLKEIIGRVMLKVFGLKRSLCIYYKVKTGVTLDLDNPRRWNEKIQKRKLLGSDNEKYILCADKYKVREYVEKKIGKEYLIPLYLSKEKITEGDIDKLPNSFVLKTNNGSKTNIIVTNKETENKKKLVKKMNRFVKYKFGYRSFELFYNKIKPLIIAEKYLECEKDTIVPNDYKFSCFKQKDNTFKIIIQVDHNRYTKDHCRVYVDEEWNLLPYGNDMDDTDYKFDKPKNLDKMLVLVKKLASDFNYVRVDLYDVSGKIYFGELTFTDGSGYSKFNPDKYDFVWGDYWVIDDK